ncbi:TNF receptor-associated factor family protein DDB_G0272098-like [Centruroides vittatus]|uniref:TNF receptor-associated factor family protein DDB_G0272098-like n=1 Tax=Centruroides vittatus TaxID=120091 RepID=UPI00350FD8B9
MKNYEIISTILHNKTLLTYKEMRDKITDVEEQIQNSFGLFKLTSFLKEIKDEDENGNNYHLMMIIFGSLAGFLIIIIIISFIFSRLKKSKHSKSTKNEFINGNTKSIEQEFENQESLHSSNNPEAVIVEKFNRLDQVDQSAVNEANPSVRNNKFYFNKAYDDRYDDIDLDQNEIKEAKHSKISKNYNEDQKNITNNYENLDSLNSETETKQIEFKAEQHQSKSLQNETELDSSNISESERQEIDENNIENDQNKEQFVLTVLATVNTNENVSLKDEDQTESDDDEDDSEFKNRKFSHRDSLTRLASFSEHVEHQSSDDEDAPFEQGPKRSIVSFNDITEYIP